MREVVNKVDCQAIRTAIHRVGTCLVSGKSLHVRRVGAGIKIMSNEAKML